MRVAILLVVLGVFAWSSSALSAITTFHTASGNIGCAVSPTGERG